MFTINDTDKAFVERIDKKAWPIYHRTPNKNNIKVGDQVVFYKAGNEGQKFIGSAEISSELKKINNLTYSIGLTNTKVWKKTVSIHDLLEKLTFIGNSQLWSTYMQGGVKRISDSDYALLVAKSKT